MKAEFRLFIFYVLIIAGLFFSLGLHDYFFLRPQSQHQWRQADCLSFTLNYAVDKNPLLEPALHNMMSDGGESGKTAGEFPILYYAVGRVWQVTGQKEWVFRLINLSIFSLALFACCLLIYQKSKSFFGALGIAVLLFTVPIFSYYAPNFLTNITAFSFVLLGWFFAMKYYDRQNMWLGVLAVACFALAPLLKITALISIFALAGILVLHLLFPKRALLKKLSTKFWVFSALGFVSILALSAIWYNYSRSYNTVHGGWFTFNDLWPIWQADKLLLEQTAQAVLGMWIWDYFTLTGYFFLLAALVVIAKTWKSIPLFLRLMIVFVFLGNVLYVLLWFKALRDHDYYVINLYFLPILIWFTALYQLKDVFLISSVSRFFGLVLFALILVSSVNYGRERMYFRYFGWINDDGLNKQYSYFDITPYLRDELKISREDLIITYPDPSYSITLYLSDQKGWPMGQERELDYVDYYTNLGAEYLLVNDSSFYKKAGFEDLKLTKMGQHRNITIFKIRPKP